MDKVNKKGVFNNLLNLDRKVFRLEKLFGSPFVDVFEFLRVLAPGRMKLLRKILTKIGWQFDGPFMVELTMPGGVGGKWYKELGMITINPFILLFGNITEIAHILIHEAHHAGMYGEPQIEEVLTEELTKNMMFKIFGTKGIKTGYDEIVRIFRSYTNGMSYEQIYELIKNGDEETLHNMIDLIVGKPIIDSKNILQLQWQNIQYQLKRKWKIITILFPRTLNSTFQTNAGLHEDANVHPAEYKLEELQLRIAKRLIEPLNIHLIREIFDKSFSSLKEFNLIEMKAILAKNGYQYLLDFKEVAPTIYREMNMYIHRQIAKYN